MTLHRPVMLEEAVAGLAVRDGDLLENGIYVDATFGRGGHSAAILARLGPHGRLHALDQDPQAVAHARERFGGEPPKDPRFTIHHHNFAELAAVAREAGIAGRVDGVLMDLGVSSPQLDDAARGFSFGKDGPLDMRMNPQAGESAAAWLARAKEEEIADVLWQYGEERNSRRIARRIVETRGETPLTTTAQLAALIAAVPGPRSKPPAGKAGRTRQRIHPATRSFQAIRIHINRELDALADGLRQAVDVLAPGGRLAVISFHSLEDRLVKRYLRDEARKDAPTLKLHGKQFPTREEASENPRARSAVLRLAERLP
ncbi:MAG: 16S rRNA (cytosine(1402)-N(4))-methyltransferase RsmH [Solimonas sp.]